MTAHPAGNRPRGGADARTPKFRYTAAASDARKVRALVTATRFFSPDEVAIAEELVTERLHKGPRSGYEFVFADAGQSLAGYACYGSIAGTVTSFDLYWIAVAPDGQGHGLGMALLREVENRVRIAGGKKIYVDTSSRRQYAPTRAFYKRCRYREVARLPGFYSPGDGKIIFVRELRARGAGRAG